jgi:hypothetical protein
MIDFEYLLTIIGAIFAAIFGFRQFYRWRKGVKVKAKIRKNFDVSKADKIIATVINRSDESQYITRCEARSTYPFSTILIRHLKNPFLSPKLYKTIWYNSPSFGLLSEDSRKIEPFEPVTLEHKLSNHPLAKMLTSTLQVEVELSSGRIFRSSRIKVPKSWTLKS